MENVKLFAIFFSIFVRSRGALRNFKSPCQRRGIAVECDRGFNHCYVLLGTSVIYNGAHRLDTHDVIASNTVPRADLQTKRHLLQLITIKHEPPMGTQRLKVQTSNAEGELMSAVLYHPYDNADCNYFDIDGGEMSNGFR